MVQLTGWPQYPAGAPPSHTALISDKISIERDTPVREHPPGQVADLCHDTM